MVTAAWPHDGVCWHVTSTVNRSSIERHGLDWARMGATGGIAAGADAPAAYRRPEMPGIFLCGTRDDVEFFLMFGGHPLVDVWEVRIDGIQLEDGPDGWLLCRTAIPPSRLRLVQSDVPAPEQPA